MPDWNQHLRPRLATLRLKPAREAEIVDELSQHLDERYEELRAGGGITGSRPTAVARWRDRRRRGRRSWRPYAG